MNTKCSLIFTIILFCFYGMQNSVYTQDLDIDSEILVYFLPDSLELPDGTTELMDVNQLKIKSKDLDKAFKKIELKSIKKAFPDFNINDTLKTDKNGKKIKLPNMSRIFKLKLNKKDDINTVVKILAKEKGVLFAEKHSNIELFINDSRYNEQWHLNNTGQSSGTSDADIDAPEAWTIFKGSSSVKIGIMDTGVEVGHDDLSGKTSGDSPESYPYDGYAHGTHVAGIAAGKHNNSGKIKGVDANSQIISKKLFSSYQYNPYTGTDDPKWAGDGNAYNKIVDAVNGGANVLNNSYGGSGYSTTLRMAFTYAYKYNCTSIVSMGNNNTSTPYYPAAFGQGIIAIGATDHNDARASYSNFGNHIDVCAPGGDGNPGTSEVILSTWRGNSYYSIDGTSMAAPVVTGIASLLKGYKSSLYNDDIENIIRISADDKSAAGWDQYYGTGRVNAKKALEYVRAPYILEHNSVSGGSIYSSTGNYSTVLYGVSGLADGLYIVKRYEVRKNVSLNSSLLNKQVWGRGVNSIGFSAESPNYGMGWCDVVSSNSTSATLRTYVYYIYNILGQPIGYFPSSPSNVSFQYSVLGYTMATPTISMSGSVGDNPTLTFSYNDNVVDHFILKKEYDFGSGYGSPQYVNPASNPYTDQNVEITKFGGDLVARYSVKVVDAFGNQSGFSNTVSTLGQSLWKENQGVDELLVITEYELYQNYPNPFNPSTQIIYQIPEDGFVNLVLYNSLGEKVAQLVNKFQATGKYSVQFNASELPSGIYFYKLKTGNYSSVKKMLLTK